MELKDIQVIDYHSNGFEFYKLWMLVTDLSARKSQVREYVKNNMIAGDNPSIEKLEKVHERKNSAYWLVETAGDHQL